MIQAVTSPQITELQTADNRLKIRDAALVKEIKELNAIKSQGSKETVDDRESLIALVLAGEDVAPASDVDSRLKTAWQTRAAINDARESLRPKLAAARREAGDAILQSADVQKRHSEYMKRIAPPLAEIAKAYAELFAMSRELRDREVGFKYGVCQTMPLDLFGPPTPYSPLADFLNACVKAGYIGTLPREYRAS
jgi:hypothetical protein